MRRGWLPAAGIGAAVVFTGGWLVAGLTSSTADVVTGTLSDLGAATADDAWVWNGARTAAGALVVAVAVGLYRRLGGLPGARAGSALLAAFGVALALGLLFRRDCRTTEPGCGTEEAYSWRHVGHELVSPFGSLGLMLALVLLTRAFRSEPRLAELARYSTATVAAFALLLVAYVLREEQHGAGIVQRLSAVVVFAWLALAAYCVDALAAGELTSSGRRRPPEPLPPTPPAPRAPRR